jgi:hypothetical protein
MHVEAAEPFDNRTEAQLFVRRMEQDLSRTSHKLKRLHSELLVTGMFPPRWVALW